MRGGTTQPARSEDLWAQVGALKPGTARWGGEPVRRETSPKAGVNAGLDRRYGRVGLDFGEVRGRLLTELRGA